MKLANKAGYLFKCSTFPFKLIQNLLYLPPVVQNVPAVKFCLVENGLVHTI